MSATEYVVLRPMLTDAGGRANVEYRAGDPITIGKEDEARAVYLLDAGFIARPGADEVPAATSAATSDAPEREDLDLSDDDEPAADAADAAEALKPARRRTRRAG